MFKLIIHSWLLLCWLKFRWLLYRLYLVQALMGWHCPRGCSIAVSNRGLSSPSNATSIKHCHLCHTEVLWGHVNIPYQGPNRAPQWLWQQQHGIWLFCDSKVHRWDSETIQGLTALVFYPELFVNPPIKILLKAGTQAHILSFVKSWLVYIIALHYT